MPRNVTAHLLSSEFSTDGLRVIGLSGSEAISRLYSFDIDVVTDRPNAPFAPQLLGSQVLLAFTSSEGVERVIAGIVAEAKDGLDVASQLRTYRLRVVPRAYRLTQLIYSEKYSSDLADILSKKLELCDVPYEARIGSPFVDDPPGFRAQYNESDFDFLARRLEHYGASFFFLTDRNGDRIIATDDGRFEDRRRELHVPFQSRGERTDIFKLVANAQMTPSLYMVADYNYRQPDVECVGKTELGSGTGGGIIEYGANVKSPEDAATLSRVRAEEHESRRLVFEGESDRSELFPGLRFTLDGHPYFGDLELLVTEVEHAIEQPAQNSERGTLAYSNRFRAVPSSVRYRPPRRTKRPFVPGVVSGIVLAPPEGPPTKPWLDDRGRYRVQLTSEFFQMSPSDRKARSMRMVQLSAGAGYGTHFPLRPGTEVMLGFVNGDPDRPIILGAVPNDLTPSPVRGDEPLYHRISTSSGIVMEFEDSD